VTSSRSFFLSVVVPVIISGVFFFHQGKQVPGSAGRAGGLAFGGGWLRQVAASKPVLSAIGMANIPPFAFN